MFLFADKFQARYIQAWLVEHPLILGLYAIFIGIVVVSLFILFWIFMKKIAIPLYKKFKQNGEKEAIEIKDNILSLLQSNSKTSFSIGQIQIELKIEKCTTVILALQILEKEGKIKKLKLPHGLERYIYNNQPE